MKKTIIVLLICATFLSTPFCQTFNDKLSSQEQQDLASGKLVIRNIEVQKNMALNPVNKDAEVLIGAVKKLKPAYLVELIQIVPYSGNEHVLKKITALLTDIPAYKGIPYYSVKQQQWYDLYSKALVISQKKEGNQTQILALLEMNPFGDIETKIEIIESDEKVWYQAANTKPIKYDGITAVGKDKMQSFVYAFRQGDSLILYGVGGVNAPTLFIKDRIETSFVNRIKSFCTHIFSKL